ncbi:MAG: lipoyl(octanoyl) transferase LipB [Chloroflexi bacterium]|nr:lipoyl(octanoyl) transferase LipB [Chloroflexota bacterium]
MTLQADARTPSDESPEGVVRLWRPGLVDYHAALEWQQARAAALYAGSEGEALVLLEHPPVYTLGARGNDSNLLATPQALAAFGAQVVHTDRGGDVTFHGPGQLVAYPILDLRGRGIGAAAYVRALEAIMIEAVAHFGVRAERVRGRPGVWVDGAKLAAVGVRVSRGVSRHGLALNVSTDLEWFARIVPCGIPDIEATSLERLLGEAPPMREVEDALAEAFAREFGCRLEPASWDAPAPTALAGVAS